jgi:hypothetical protein
MTYPHAIFGGLGLVAAAILVGALAGAPRAADGGPYEGVAASRGGQTGGFQSGDVIWRVNKQTGAVSLCFGPNQREQPVCSPWSR